MHLERADTAGLMTAPVTEQAEEYSRRENCGRPGQTHYRRALEPPGRVRPGRTLDAERRLDGA